MLAGGSACPTLNRPREEIGSVRRGPNDEMEAGGLGERTEIPVSRKQGDPAIDTALRDQCIAEARLTALGQHLRSQLTCPLPIAGLDQIGRAHV